MAVPGSVDSMLASDPALRELVSEYSDGVMRSFGVDVRSKPSFLNRNVVRSAAGYLRDYGDDAVRIVRAVYSPPYNGRCRGRAMGPEVFARGMRWFSNDVLLRLGD